MSLIGEVILVVLAGLIAGSAYVIKDYVAKEVDNDLLNRLVTDGVNYAEQLAKEYAKSGAEKLDGSKKLKYAKEYIEIIDPMLFMEHKEDIENIIKAKVGELFGTI